MIGRVDKQAMAALEAMINSMAFQSSAELGSFWYDKNNKELFGVHSLLQRIVLGINLLNLELRLGQEKHCMKTSGRKSTLEAKIKGSEVIIL